MPCSARMIGCKRSCLHRQMVQEYRLERHRQELVREAETNGHAAELALYPPIVTFKDWLKSMRRG